MLHKWRKYYNLNTDGGGGVDTLDSPGPTGNVASVEVEEPAIPAAPINADSNGDVTKPVDKTVENNPNQQAPPKEGEEEEEVEVEKSVYELADEALGFGVAADLPEGIEGLAEFGKRSYTKGAEDAVAKEWEELQREAAPAVELARWLKSGRSEQEFYLSKVQAPTIEPTTLDTASEDVLENIVYNNFIKQGFPEATAKRYTQMAKDANSLREDAKEIVTITNQRKAEEDAAAEAARVEQARKDYEAFEQRINARINTVKAGKLGAVMIPAAQQDAFIQANFYDAGDPQYPGSSAIDIKMANMTPEENDLIRYFVHIGLDNVNKVIQARSKTVDVAKEILKTKGAGSRMTGGANRTGEADDRTLDSPGT